MVASDWLIDSCKNYFLVALKYSQILCMFLNFIFPRDERYLDNFTEDCSKDQRMYWQPFTPSDTNEITLNITYMLYHCGKIFSQIKPLDGKLY